MARQMCAAFDEVADWDATRERIAQDHAALAEAVQAGDCERAASTVEEHIRGFYRLLHGDNEH